MPVDNSLLRSIFLDYLRSNPDGQFSMMEDIQRYYNRREINLEVNDLQRIQQMIHELYAEGIIAFGRKINPPRGVTLQLFDHPFYHVTEYGEKVLDNTEYQPYDPDGYLQKLQAEITTVDPIIIRYLEECLSCFRRNLLLSAAVTLGCASEKAILLLTGVFGETLEGDDKVAFQKETNTYIISRKYRALWSRLEPVSSSLPDNLGYNLESIIHNTFDIIRATRNEAGHPSGNIIEKETVHANLLLFPIFCKRIYKLIEHFSGT